MADPGGAFPSPITVVSLCFTLCFVANVCTFCTFAPSKIKRWIRHCSQEGQGGGTIAYSPTPIDCVHVTMSAYIILKNDHTKYPIVPLYKVLYVTAKLYSIVRRKFGTIYHVRIEFFYLKTYCCLVTAVTHLHGIFTTPREIKCVQF